MINKLKKMTRGEARLLLAVGLCVVLFVASPTSPTDDSTCGGDHGKLAVSNNSDQFISVSVSGPRSFSFSLNPDQTGTTETKVGTYTWKAVTTSSIFKNLVTTGTAQVKKDQTTTVVVTFNE